jgi:predicted transcriptional regulator
MTKDKEDRKARVLEAVDQFTEMNGYPPSYRDLAFRTTLAHSVVWYLVEALRADGLLNERSSKTSRAIVLTDRGRAALRAAD